MENIDFKQRATKVVRSAIQIGCDAHETAPEREVEYNLESHVDTELDIIWEEQGDKSGEEWDEIKEEIILEIPDALEKVQQETDFDFYNRRVREQFDEI